MVRRHVGHQVAPAVFNHVLRILPCQVRLVGIEVETRHQRPYRPFVHPELPIIQKLNVIRMDIPVAGVVPQQAVCLEQVRLNHDDQRIRGHRGNLLPAHPGTERHGRLAAVVRHVGRTPHPEQVKIMEGTQTQRLALDDVKQAFRLNDFAPVLLQMLQKAVDVHDIRVHGIPDVGKPGLRSPDISNTHFLIILIKQRPAIRGQGIITQPCIITLRQFLQQAKGQLVPVQVLANHPGINSGQGALEPVLVGKQHVCLNLGARTDIHPLAARKGKQR